MTPVCPTLLLTDQLYMIILTVIEIIDDVLRLSNCCECSGHNLCNTEVHSPHDDHIQATVVCVTFLLSPYLYCSEHTSGIIQFKTGYRLVCLVIHAMLKHRLYEINFIGLLCLHYKDHVPLSQFTFTLTSFTYFFNFLKYYFALGYQISSFKNYYAKK